MSKILVCLIAPFAILFAGLAPGYVWAIPLAIGAALIITILMLNDSMDERL